MLRQEAASHERVDGRESPAADGPPSAALKQNAGARLKVLIDLQHPAHLYFFLNLVRRLRRDGHEVVVTARDKDVLLTLCRESGIEVEQFGEAKPGMLRMGMELVERQARLLGILRRQRPSLCLAVAGTYLSLPAKWAGVPCYVFYDTEHATLSNLLSYPFCTCVYVPESYSKPIRWPHVRYAGFHELAYLHPDVFEPEATVLDEAGIAPAEKFAIVRFVGWGAAHDLGRRGLSADDKLRAVERISSLARVVVSSEGPLPDALEPLRLRIRPSRLHHLMSFASLVFGESGTMPSEAAMLGVPSVYVNPLRLGYLEELRHRYGLVSIFQPPEGFDAAVGRAEEILRSGDRTTWQAARRRLLAEKINVAEMLYELVLAREAEPRPT